MTCDRTRLSLGAYLLGAIDPVESAAVEAHVGGCPACRAELAELAELPPLLDRLTPADVDKLDPGIGEVDQVATLIEAELGPGPELLDRLLDRASRRLRRRRLLLSVAVAAALLAVVLGGGSMIMTLTRPMPPGQAIVLTGADPGSRVHGEARLTAESWGTSIAVDLVGLPAGTECGAVAVAFDGRRQSLGAWRAGYSGAAGVTVATSFTPAEVESLVITELDHDQLVRLRR